MRAIAGGKVTGERVCYERQWVDGKVRESVIGKMRAKVS